MSSYIFISDFTISSPLLWFVCDPWLKVQKIVWKKNDPSMKKLVALAFKNIFFYWEFFFLALSRSKHEEEMVGGLLDELRHLQLWWLDWRGQLLLQLLPLPPPPMLMFVWNFGYSPICLGWNPSFKFRASAWPDSKWCKAHRSWTLGWHTIITDGRSQPL